MAEKEKIVSMCVGCGCTDVSACLDDFGTPCHWLRLDTEKEKGVCSECRDVLHEWDTRIAAGDAP